MRDSSTKTRSENLIETDNLTPALEPEREKKNVIMMKKTLDRGCTGETQAKTEPTKEHVGGGVSGILGLTSAKHLPLRDKA